MSEPIFFDDAAAFGRWLEANAATETELLVGFRKRGSGRASLSWSESVDEALCVGWIDGLTKRLDDTAYTVRFTPRKPRSIWSAVNIAKVEALTAQKRMQPAGLAAFAERSAARSAIYAHEQPEVAELRVEELRTFRRAEAAWAYFEQCPPGYRKLQLHWVTTAKRAETRAARLATLIAACAAGKRLR